MRTILTISFSPCLDKSTSIDKLVPEKKLRCSIPRIEPGGGGINVARAITRLGGKAVALFPIGGYTGEAFKQLLNKEGVPSIHITTKNETRENIVVFETSSKNQYRFVIPGAELKENEWHEMIQIIEDIKDVDYVVASGSLPPGVPTDIFGRIASIAKIKRAKFIVDTSGEALKHAINQGIYLVKPSLSELSYLAGKDHLESGEIEDEARKIIKNGNCEFIVVSLGAQGAMLVTTDKSLLIASPQVEVKSTVGAGDSMVAGILTSLSKGDTIERAAQYGVACGTAATMNEGTELCKKEDADRLLAGITLSAGKNVLAEASRQG